MLADLLQEGSVLIAQGCTPEHCASHQAGTIQMLIFATVSFLLSKLPVSEEQRFFFSFHRSQRASSKPSSYYQIVLVLMSSEGMNQKQADYRVSLEIDSD